MLHSCGFRITQSLGAWHELGAIGRKQHFSYRLLFHTLAGTFWVLDSTSLPCTKSRREKEGRYKKKYPGIEFAENSTKVTTNKDRREEMKGKEREMDEQKHAGCLLNMLFSSLSVTVPPHNSSLVS